MAEVESPTIERCARSPRFRGVCEGSTRKGTGHGLRYRVRFMVDGLFQYYWLMTVRHCDAGRLEGR